MNNQETLLKKISTTIIEKRKEHNLTQKQLADKLGISNTTLSYYERGERTPELFTLVEIATMFDISLDELLGIKKEKAHPINTVGDLARALISFDESMGIVPVYKTSFPDDNTGKDIVFCSTDIKEVDDWIDGKILKHGLPVFVEPDYYNINDGEPFEQEYRPAIKIGFFPNNGGLGARELDEFMKAYMHARRLKVSLKLSGFKQDGERIYLEYIERALQKADKVPVRTAETLSTETPSDETDINELPF